MKIICAHSSIRIIRIHFHRNKNWENYGTYKIYILDKSTFFLLKSVGSGLLWGILQKAGRWKDIFYAFWNEKFSNLTLPTIQWANAFVDEIFRLEQEKCLSRLTSRELFSFADNCWENSEANRWCSGCYIPIFNSALYI